MPKLMNEAVEVAGLDAEAAVEVLNRILHCELNGVMQHFHHQWMSRWLRSSRARAIVVGQHIASLTGGPSVAVDELMTEALAASEALLRRRAASSGVGSRNTAACSSWWRGEAKGWNRLHAHRSPPRRATSPSRLSTASSRAHDCRARASAARTIVYIVRLAPGRRGDHVVSSSDFTGGP